MATATTHYTAEHDAVGLRLADVVIIGAAKSGTSTLFAMLSQHPKIAASSIKEPRFFDRDENYAYGVGWYASLWGHADDDQLRLEGSTDYARMPDRPDTPARMADLIPDARLIYLMRHPVERCYSWYTHCQQFVDRPVGFRTFLETDKYCLSDSLYLKHIAWFLRRYDRGQMHLIIDEDFRADPEGVVNGLLESWGLPPADAGPLTEEQANRRGNQVATQHLNGVIARVKRVPGVNLVSSIVPKAMRSWIYEQLRRTSLAQRSRREFLDQISPLDDGVRAELLERYEQPTRDLEAFLGREMPAWHQ